jgi:cell division protease FtsH
MSPLGPLHFRPAGNGWDTDRKPGMSEATAQRVDEEVREIVMRGYETSRQILEKNRPALKALAEELLKVESLDAAAIRAVLAASSVPPRRTGPSA